MADGQIPEQRALPMQVAGDESSEGALDRLGVGISLGCAVHCLASALVSLVPSLVADVVPWLERLEWPFLIGAAVVGASSLLPAYRRHLEARPIALFSLGMVLLSASRLVEGPLELALTVSALLGIATAHLLNLRACTAPHACR
jgi:hypothetical protein